MDNKLNEEIYRIKFLLNFDKSKSLIEQTSSTIGYEAPSDATSVKLPNEPIKDDSCRYPDKAIEPPRHHFGSESGAISGFCYYPAPLVTGEGGKGGTTGIYINRFSDIQFRDLIDYVEIIEKVEKKYGSKEPAPNQPHIKDYISEILPLNTVRSFESDGKVYRTRISRKEFGKWRFNGFWSDDGKLYVEPTWASKRTPYEKFIDDWGILIQIAAGFLAAAIIPPLGLSFTRGVLLELAIEIGVGVPVALREFETNQPISGTFSLIFAVLPALKFTKMFKGFDKATSLSLSEKFKYSKLTKLSTPEDFIKFYETLTQEEKNLLAAFLKSDESAEVIGKNILEEINNDLKKQIISEMNTNPSKFKELNFWNRITGTELGLGGILILIYFKLSAEEEDLYLKGRIEYIAQLLSKSQQNEYAYNLMVLENNEKIKQSINVMYELSKINLSESNYLESPKIKEALGIDDAVDVLAGLMMKYSIESLGNEYIEIDSTQTPIDLKPETTTQEYISLKDYVESDDENLSVIQNDTLFVNQDYQLTLAVDTTNVSE